MANPTCRVDRIVRFLIVITVTLSTAGFDFQSYNHASYLDAHSETSATVRMPAAQEATTVAPKTSQPAVTLPRYFLPIAPLTYASEQTIAAEATIADRTRVASALRSAPVMFIENVGQVDPNARFQVRGAGGTIYLASDAVWVTLLEPPRPPELANQREDRRPFDRVQLETPRKGVNLRFTFEGANPNPRIEGFDRFDTAVSYFIGDDPNQWRTNVPVWGGVRYVDLYPSIDLEITSLDGEWAWRLVARGTSRLSPEGQEVEVGDVRLRVEGADHLSLDSGHLLITTAIGQFTIPLIQVDGVSSIPAELKDDADLISPASHGRPNGLAILYFIGTGQVTQNASKQQAVSSSESDVFYSTYLGGSDYDTNNDIAVDESGAAYVTGYAQSVDFPTTTGSFSTTLGGGADAFVTKLNADGSGLVYSTFLGGSNDDRGQGIEVDANGAAYITGLTGSANFPVTPGALAYAANLDAFVTKLNAAGNGLIYSTFLGGTANDRGYSIAVDANGAAYVTGSTASSNFPIVSAFQTTCISCTFGDAFVTKIDPSQAGTASLIYSTYLGGSHDDDGLGIAVDANGAAYITGDTGSSDFPTQGAYQSTCQSCSSGYGDAFVTKLSTSGSALIFSTYLGGNDIDGGYGIAVDTNGAAYVTGVTNSSDFPTAGELQSCDGCPTSSDAFVTKLNTGGNGLVYSTFLGGSRSDSGLSIAVDASGMAYITGDTNSADFPITAGAFQTTCGCSTLRTDAFVTKLNTGGNGLVYSTFLGGTGYEAVDGSGIALGTDGEAYVTGDTDSSDFPTTPGAFQRTCSTVLPTMAS